MYLLTFMFHKIMAGGYAVRAAMYREVERIYATLLTRIVREPRKASPTDLPLWIVCPDFPVPKSKKLNLAVVTVNDGQHLHALALIPPSSRLHRPFDAEVRRNQGLLTGNGTNTMRVDAVHVVNQHRYVADYGLKALRSGRVGFDDIMLLPRVVSELPSKGSGA